RGVHGRGLESHRCRTGVRGILVHSRESQEQLQAAAPDPRGAGKGLLCGDPGDTGGGGRGVLRGGGGRGEPPGRRTPAPRPTSPALFSTSVAFPTGRGRGRACFRHPMSRSPSGSKRSSPSRQIHIRSFRHSSATNPARRGRGSYSAGTTAGAPLALINTTRNLAGLVLLALRPMT